MIINLIFLIIRPYPVGKVIIAFSFFNEIYLNIFSIIVIKITIDIIKIPCKSNAKIQEMNI